jgi:netrin-G3 ligand
MVKPDFYGVVNSAEIQVILPQASEEYGPISHYYLIVVPEDKLNAQKNPDQFLTDEVSSVVSYTSCLCVRALSVACAM